MEPDEFEYEPLEKLFRALEGDTDSLDTESLKQSLRERGLDPDRTIASVKRKVRAYLKDRSPS